MQATEKTSSRIQEARRVIALALVMVVPIAPCPAAALPLAVTQAAPVAKAATAAHADAALLAWGRQVHASADVATITDLAQLAMWTRATTREGIVAKCLITQRVLDVAEMHWTVTYLLASIDFDMERRS